MAIHKIKIKDEAKPTNHIFNCRVNKDLWEQFKGICKDKYQTTSTAILLEYIEYVVGGGQIIEMGENIEPQKNELDAKISNIDGFFDLINTLSQQVTDLTKQVNLMQNRQVTHSESTGKYEVKKPDQPGPENNPVETSALPGPVETIALPGPENNPGPDNPGPENPEGPDQTENPGGPENPENNPVVTSALQGQDDDSVVTSALQGQDSNNGALQTPIPVFLAGIPKMELEGFYEVYNDLSVNDQQVVLSLIDKIKDTQDTMANWEKNEAYVKLLGYFGHFDTKGYRLTNNYTTNGLVRLLNGKWGFDLRGLARKKPGTRGTKTKK